MGEIQNPKSKIPDRMGVGIGFREQFRADIFLNRDKIDFLEITTDHYLDAKPQKLEELKLLKDHFPLIPHSLELSLGSAEGIEEDYLEKVAEIVEFVQPEWFSDHLCFTKSGGVKIGHLAPVPYTNEAIKVFVKNISHVKKTNQNAACFRKYYISRAVPVVGNVRIRLY